MYNTAQQNTRQVQRQVRREHNLVELLNMYVVGQSSMDIAANHLAVQPSHPTIAATHQLQQAKASCYLSPCPIPGRRLLLLLLEVLAAVAVLPAAAAAHQRMIYRSNSSSCSAGQLCQQLQLRVALAAVLLLALLLLCGTAAVECWMRHTRQHRTAFIYNTTVSHCLQSGETMSQSLQRALLLFQPKHTIHY